MLFRQVIAIVSVTCSYNIKNLSTYSKDSDIIGYKIDYCPISVFKDYNSPITALIFLNFTLTFPPNQLNELS